MLVKLKPNAVPEDYCDLYRRHLRSTMDWLLRSIASGRGGSSAHYMPVLGWSAPYPETSGYIVPTLIAAAGHLGDTSLRSRAIEVGEWLLGLQHEDGWWPGGVYRPGRPQRPSVFNSAQILDGMSALATETGDERWFRAAKRGARWLADGVDAEGLWSTGSYRPGVNPSYYSQVAWPMLMAWKLGAGEDVRAAAIRVLERVIDLRLPNGAIKGWSFDPSRPAFTHTIAYTLRGLIESAYLLDDWSRFGEPCKKALDRLARKAELSNGRLPGAYDENWVATTWYSCLTGDSQVALCLMRLDHDSADLRLVNAAAKLIDHVCAGQRIDGGSRGTRGAIAGSSPVWGRYMFMRYPNWAAKYHADALMALMTRLRSEGVA